MDVVAGERNCGEKSRQGMLCMAGPSQGRTVNIKWYLKREGLLDTTESTALDYYLVLTGPPAAAASSRGTTRPWSIQAVFLFDARQLRSEQITRG
jgi:hypothetical protein